MSSRKIFGVEVPLNEKIEFAFSTDDAQLTNLDYQDAIGRSPFTSSVLHDLRKIDVMQTPALLNRWMVSGKGEYVGTWAKRMSKYVKKQYGYNIDMGHLSVLVEHLSKAVNAAVTPYLIEFTDHANWRRGDYADANSCWFGGAHDATRLKMIDAGGGAILIHRVDGRNLGRLWYFPLESGKFSCIFNIYDFDNKLTILSMARMLSMKFGVSYMRAHELYFPDAYLNGEGSAYLVGVDLVDRPITLTFAQRKSTLEYLSGFDPFSTTLDVQGGRVPVKVERVHNDDDRWRCNGCNILFPEDIDSYELHGDTYCLTCLENGDFFVCGKCDDWEYDDEGTTIKTGERVCAGCRENRCGYCNECEEYIWGDTVFIERTDTHVCVDCCNEYYFTCEECQHMDSNDNKRKATYDRDICSDCANDGDKFSECDRCQKYEEVDNTRTVHNNNVEETWCEPCSERHAIRCDACEEMVAGIHDCPEEDADD